MAQGYRLAATFVALISFAVYLPAIRNGFAYDDVPIIANSDRIHSLDGIGTAFTRPYWDDADRGLYRPLTTASFVVDWAISGGKPAWFQFANILWHVAACVLVFMVLARFTGVAPAFAGAILFAIHPVHVEAVANVVGRAETMAAVWTLAAILLWPAADDARPRTWLGAIACLFCLGLLTKESAIMLPALLVLIDIWRGDCRPGATREWLRHRRAAAVVLIMTTGMYIGLRYTLVGGLAPARVDAAFEMTSGIGQIATAAQAWPEYVRLLLFPATLLADYGPRIIMPAQPFTLRAIIGALVIAGLVTGGAFAWKRNSTATAVALLWFPIAILPVSNLIVRIGTIVAERTLYLPSMAVAAAVAIVLDGLWQRRPARVVALVSLVILTTLFSVRTIVRIPDWKSTDTIMAALLRDRPDSYRAHWYYARLAVGAGDVDAALQHYGRALELWPHRRALVLEATYVAARNTRLAWAREVSALANRQWPDDMESARVHAAIILDMADTTAARDVIVRALLLSPTDSLLLRMRAAIDRDQPQ